MNIAAVILRFCRRWSCIINSSEMYEKLKWEMKIF